VSLASDHPRAPGPVRGEELGEANKAEGNRLKHIATERPESEWSAPARRMAHALLPTAGSGISKGRPLQRRAMAFMSQMTGDVETWVQNWWAVVLRGVVGVVFGLTVFMWPGISLAALVLIYGAYAFVDGVFAVVGALRRPSAGHARWVTLLRGALGVGAGVVTVLWPGITALALLYVIAAWAIIGGVLEIMSAVRLRKTISGEWLLALGGVLAIALGVMLMLFPGPGALALVLWVGAFAIVFGIALIALGLRLRAWGRQGLGPRELGRMGGAAPASHP
jgi:uncharacterized membrane protein HdeD (DUF308 family)